MANKNKNMINEVVPMSGIERRRYGLENLQYTTDLYNDTMSEFTNVIAQYEAEVTELLAKRLDAILDIMSYDDSNEPDRFNTEGAIREVAELLETHSKLLKMW